MMHPGSVQRPPTAATPATPSRTARLWLAAVASLAICGSVAADVPVVAGGGARAVVVIPDDARPVVRHAARELVEHVRLATGATLRVVPESEAASGPVVFIGDTRAASRAGIDVAKLAPETFVLRSRGDALYIAGHDSGGEPLDTGTYAGTLFGVYEWLERDLGVRWLWPGALGTHVPKAATVRAKDVDVTVAPAFFQRNIRGGLTFKGKYAPLGFSPEAAEEYAHEQNVFLRRHRVGRSVRLGYHHAFRDWWAEYGAEHPEWFQLVDGKRGPTRAGGSYSMCVSSPGLRRQIIALWKEQREKNPGLWYINAVENGIMGLCECDNCRAWDGPAPADYLKYYPPKSKVMGSKFATDRYVRFWLELQREAEAIEPNVTIVAYNYFNYFPPPTPGTKLNRRILVGAYPSAGWFPRSPEEHAWFKQQWADWQATGARLFSRGNYCLDGYTMPLVFARQYADEFQHQVRHGLEATDYDALTGQWAAQGTNLYLLARLHTRPDAPVDTLLDEYYSAFGAASPLVRAYFEYWEQQANSRRTEINRQYEDNTSRWRAFAVAAHIAFPIESFAKAEELLARAREAVAGDEVAGRRVAFLQTGLTHAKLCVVASSLLNVRDPASTPERGAGALAELIAFRRAHQREWIANFNHCAFIEDASWRLPEAAVPAGNRKR